MNGERQSANARTDQRHSRRILTVFFFLIISFAAQRTDATSPITDSDGMKLFSYPKLGFQISFPVSWVVRDQSGDLPGEHIVEGRSTADTPSLLHDGKKLALSQEEQQLADIAFLKGIRVSVSVMNKLPTMGLLERVRNRIYGIMYLAQRKGDHVDFKQLGDVRLATVHAFVTTFTSTHNRYKALAQISTTTTYYDFEYGAREYVIDVSAPVDAFDKHAAEFSRIVRSFTFIEGR